MDNRQALGYMLCAAKEAGVNRELLKKLHNEMNNQMDLKTEEEAEDIGYNWYFEIE